MFADSPPNKYFNCRAGGVHGFTPLVFFVSIGQDTVFIKIEKTNSDCYTNQVNSHHQIIWIMFNLAERGVHIVDKY